MYSVSADFNAQMVADKRKVSAKIQVDWTSPDLDQSLQVSANEQANISYISQTADGITAATHKWASLDGTWRLDQDYRLAPKPEDLYRYQFGWWSASLSGADGTFAAPYPTLTVTHLPRPIYSLRVVGDSARGEYPVAFVIRLKDQSGNVLHTETVTNNTQVEWSKTLTTPVLDVARQELEIQKWSHPGRNAKILEFFTSIQETYYSDDIVEIKLLEEREASQGSLPIGNITANEISIRLANDGGKFDPTNPNSPLFRLLKPNRRIKAWLGLKGDGNGQTVTHTNTSQSDWQQGTLDGVVATATGDLALVTHVEAGAATAYSNSGSYYGYRDTQVQSYWTYVNTNNSLVIPVPGSGKRVVAIAMNFSWSSRYGTAGLRIGGVDTGIRFKFGDQTGTETKQSFTKTSGQYAIRWDYKRDETKGGGTRGVMYVLVPEGQTSIEWFIDTSQPYTTGSNPAWIMQNYYVDVVSYEKAQGTLFLGFTPTQGSRTSPSLDLSPVGIAASSSISWAATTPPGTSVTVETRLSLDDGATWGPWQQATNGGPVPGITAGMDLSKAMLQTRVTLSTTDTTVTPQVHELTIQVNHEEWVPLGTFWSLDWDSPDDSLEASVVARDRLELLRKSTYQPGQVQQNVSLYTLAEQVLIDAGLKAGEYWIDPALQQIVVPWAWLSPTSHREALRIIAEAVLAVVYADRDGVIRIESMGSVPDTPVLTITEDDYFPPLRAPAKQESVANEIIVTTQPLVPAATPEEVYRSTTPITVPAGQTVKVTVQYTQAPVIEASASLDAPPAGVSITAATYYAWGAEVSIQNASASQANVTLVITGKPLSVQGGEQVVVRDEASILENGVLRYEYPANPLVQTLAQAQAIATALLASAKDPRRDIEVEWRGNPALELGDRVTVAGQDVHVIRQEIAWAGALMARLTGRKVT